MSMSQNTGTMSRIQPNLSYDNYFQRSPADKNKMTNTSNPSKVDKPIDVNAAKALTPVQRANLQNMISGILGATKGKLSMTPEKALAYVLSRDVKIDLTNKYQVTIALTAYQELKGDNQKVEVTFTENGDLNIVIRGNRENPDYKVDEYNFSKEELAKIMPQDKDSKNVNGGDSNKLRDLQDKIKRKIDDMKAKKQAQQKEGKPASTASNSTATGKLTADFSFSAFVYDMIRDIMDARIELEKNIAKKLMKTKEQEMEELDEEKRLKAKKDEETIREMRSLSKNLERLKIAIDGLKGSEKAQDLVKYAKSITEILGGIKNIDYNKEDASLKAKDISQRIDKLMQDLKSLKK